MFVPCPHCGFLVALIVAEDGPPQHCPRCDNDLQEDAGGGPGPPATSTVTPPLHDTPAASSDEPSVGAEAPSSATGEAPPTAAVAPEPRIASPEPRPRHDKRRAPSFVRAVTRPHHTGPRWPGVLAIGLLATLLLTQLLMAQRDALAADARWRPAVGTVCKVLACRLPTWHEPAAYTMLARSVQPASGKEGVLRVQASFRNDAHWPQAWPALQLNLSDINGQTVARRVFKVHEYHPADASLPTELAPGQSASVDFEILEPTPRIVAFTFDFR